MTNIKLKQDAPELSTTYPNITYLRVGQMVMYRRKAGTLYQCQYKLANGRQHMLALHRYPIGNFKSDDAPIKPYVTDCE